MYCRGFRLLALANALFVTGFVSAASARADSMTIASYNFFGGSSSSAPGTWGSPITFGTGIGTPAFTSDKLNIGGAETLATAGPSTYDNFNEVMGPSITGNQYASFTVTIPDDVVVNLTDLNYDYEMVNRFDFGMGVFSDATGFTLGNQLAQHFDGGSSGNVSFLNQNIDLSTNPAFQNLTDTMLEFRFYMGDGSTSNSRDHFFDNFELIGDVLPLNTDVNIVPEPASIAIWTLAGAAMAGFGVWRRRLAR